MLRFAAIVSAKTELLRGSMSSSVQLRTTEWKKCFGGRLNFKIADSLISLSIKEGFSLKISSN